MGPDWLGSPQHVVAGAAIAGAVVVMLRRRGTALGTAAALGVGAVATAELVWEVAEYALRYAGQVRVTAYVDTIADLASSLAGGLLGAIAGLIVTDRRGRRG